MKRMLPAHVYARKGGLLYFERRGWPSRRIHAEPGTAAFATEYALILSGEPPIKGAERSFKRLIASYKRSPRFTKLAPRTREDYDKVLEWAEEKLGKLPADRIQRKDVIRARDQNAGKARFASYIVQVLRILMEHAIDLGWRVDNPVKGVGLVKAETSAREAWPPEKVSAFRAHAGERPRLVFELCIGTGQRIGDVLRMRWDEIEGAGIHVRQGKTGARLWVPFTPALEAALASTERKAETIVARQDGDPLSYRTAAQEIMAVRKLEAVKAEDFDIHGLRYTTAAELAAAGCDDDLIMAVTGHSTRKMVALYAGAVRQKTRATEAQKRREQTKDEPRNSEPTSEP